jgi:hypothetical protein
MAHHAVTTANATEVEADASRHEYLQLSNQIAGGPRSKDSLGHENATERVSFDAGEPRAALGDTQPRHGTAVPALAGLTEREAAN